MKKGIFTLVLLLLIASMAFSQNRYVKANVLNLRADKNTSSKVLTKLNRNTGVKVIKTFETGWSYVEVNYEKGYVSSRYLSETKVQVRAKVEQQVYICNSKSSYAYHSHFCRGLNRCKAGTSKVSKSQAKNSGYKACKICY